MNLTISKLSKQGLGVISSVDKYIDAFVRAKAKQPERVLVGRKDYETLMNSFSNPKPERIEYRGIRIEFN